MIPDHPDSPLLPTAYRGSLRMTAEVYLADHIGGPSPHGYANAEGWRGGYLIHRCTDKKTGAWVEVTPGERHERHKLVAQGHKE